MKKIMLFVAVILFGSNAISQTKTYLLFEFMKVAPGQESAYLKTESFWEKIHNQRVENGEITGWQLWRMESDNVNSDYQYVTVHVFKDSIKMFQNGGGSFLKNAKKAFPDMSDADLESKRTESLKSRDVVETFFLKQIDQTQGKFQMSLGAVMFINFMKVSPDNNVKYREAESKIFKREWQSRVDAGTTGNWSLLKVITSNENALNHEASYVSLDKFKDLNQLLGNTNYNTIKTAEDEKAWMEAFKTREINSYRVVLIKKTGKEK